MSSRESPMNVLKHVELKNKVKEVRKLIRGAKTSHYNFEFSKHNKDIKKTWKTIADVMNKSRIQN